MSQRDPDQKYMFELLKQALKVKGKTYAQLADFLGISELSVKRMFRDKDCKISRVFEVCDFLSISLEDLLATQKRKSHTPEFLPEAMEQALASNTNLFTVFVLLISEIGTDDIKSVTGQTHAQLYMHMRELEKIGLISIGANEKIKFTVPTPVRWRFDGVLANELKQLNMRFIAHYFEKLGTPDYQLVSKSRLLSQESLEELQRDGDDLAKKFEHLASQDRLFYANDELKLVKQVIAQGPFPILNLV